MAQQIGAARTVETELLTGNDRGWKSSGGDALDQVLFLPAVELEIGRNEGGEFHHVAIEEWIARLDPIRHGHAVAVVAHQVVDQPQLEVQVGAAVQPVPSGQTLAFDRQVLETIEVRIELVHAVRIKRRLGLAELQMIRLIDQRAVAPQALTQLRLELLRAGVGAPVPVEPIPDITCEQFVGSFAGEHDGYSGAARCRRQRQRAAVVGLLERAFGEPDHRRDTFDDLGPVERDAVVLRAHMSGNDRLVGGFVHLVSGKRDREGGARRSRIRLGNERGNEGGIEATAEIEADGHVGLQAPPDRTREQRVQLFDVFGLGLRWRGFAGQRIDQIPILLDAQAAVLGHAEMPVRQASNALEHGGRRDQPRKGEHLVEAGEVDPPLHRRVPEDSLDFGGKYERAAAYRIMQRADAEWVAHQNQTPAAVVTHGRSELAVETVNEFDAFLLVEVQQDLHVAAAAETVSPSLQLHPQLRCVEDFPVADEAHRAVLVAHGLVTARQVDNREAAEAQGDRTLDVVAAIVRAPVHLDRAHGLDNRRCRRLPPIEVEIAGHSAHYQEGAAIASSACS